MLLIWWFAGGRAHGRGVELIVLQPLRASFSNVRILIGRPKGLDWPNPMSSIRTINTFGALGGALTSNVRAGWQDRAVYRRCCRLRRQLARGLFPCGAPSQDSSKAVASAAFAVEMNRLRRFMFRASLTA